MNTSHDPNFPWIRFPAEAKLGDKWTIRSKVMPYFITWQFQPIFGWVEIEAA